MVLNNFVDQVAARPPSQHSDDSELYQVDYCLLMNEGVFLFETPKDVFLHVFAEPLTTSCLALLIAAAILAQPEPPSFTFSRRWLASRILYDPKIAG